MTGAGLPDHFAAAMAALGPFEDHPTLAAGVSGGADSMALAVLADDWVKRRGGRLVALVVDHGLRSASAAEAALTVARLAGLGIAARLLTVTGLTKGPALAARARDARYRILTQACRDAGIVHLLLGHHAADQAETLMIRVLSGSGGRGLAGMPALAETRSLRILRPLLTVPPGRLRDCLTGKDVAWVEDPSNRDPNALRARLRHLRNDPAGTGTATRALADAARAAGRQRAARDEAVARVLAARAALRPEGFAILSPGPIAPEALAELLRVVAGAGFTPGLDQVAGLAAHPEPCTVWGVRLLPAGRLGNGRLGDGWLLVREEAAAAPPVPAVDQAIWDGRFRLHVRHPLPGDTVLGALGTAAARVRRHSDLPAAVLRVMPALWRGNFLVAVPQLFYPDATACDGVNQVVFEPPRPLAGAKFLPA